MGERRVSALVRLIRDGDVEAADELPEALAALPPSEPSRVLVRRLIDKRSVDGRTDSFGVPCRAALIAAQLEQGFPWALEVPPDEVEWLREAVRVRERSVDLSRAWTACIALPSLAWNAGWVALLLASRPSVWVVPFAIAAVHAAAALLTAWRAHAGLARERRVHAARVYRGLAVMAAVGPLVSFIAATREGEGLLLAGMLVALPAMATAVACLPASERILPEAR